MALQERARGRRIAELRERAHLTQEIAADKAGVTLRAYQGWEAGGGIRYANLSKLAEVLGASVEQITGEAEVPNPFKLGAKVDDVRDEFRLLVEQHNSLLSDNNRRIQDVEARLEVMERKIDRNLEAVIRLLEAMDGLTSETVAQEMERAAAVEGPAEHSTRTGIASTPGATQD